MSDLKKESMEQQVKGAWDKTKGQMKEAAGKITDREDLEAEGQMDQVKGDIRSGVGRAGERLSNAVDDMKDDFDRDRNR